MHELESGKLLGTAAVLRDALFGASRSDIVIRSGVPTVEDYCRLRALCGMGPRSDAGAAIGLPNSWYGVQALDDDRPVGMGRVVGDGGCFFQIVDICVLPQYQGHGLGKSIMRELVRELDARAPASAYVSLIADGESHRLYRRFGFINTAPSSIGMHRVKL
jgi:ribosomal protein S18 acetylase RimI-like enzyme